MSGWIKLHRKLKDWEWYTDNSTKSLFIHCLLSANIKDKNWKGQLIKRGSFITSLNKLAVELGLTKKQIRTSVNKLLKTQEIEKKGTSFTLIIINNYDDFQVEERKEDNRKGTERAQKGHRKGTERATTKEVKKLRSKEVKIKDLSETEVSEDAVLDKLKEEVRNKGLLANFWIEFIKSEFAKHNYQIDSSKSKMQFENFYEHYSPKWEKAKKSFDYKACIRRWVRNGAGKIRDYNQGSNVEIDFNKSEFE